MTDHSHPPPAGGEVDTIPTPRPSPRQRRRTRRLARRSTVVATATLALGLVAWLTLSATPRKVTRTVTQLAAPIALPPPAPQPTLRQLRPTYRHSVIPGGVFSQTELAVAVEADPVVRRHYAGFDVARARIARVSHSRAVHVSYRVGDKVYWTRKKVWLRPGEALLTDGRNEARGRCGNRVAEEILGPIAPGEEPIPETLDEEVPVAPPGIAPLEGYRLMFFDTPSIEPIPVAPLEDPIPSNPVTLLPTPPVLVLETRLPPAIPSGPVPEPGTLALLGSGVVGLAWRRLRRGYKENGGAPKGTPV